VPFENLIHRGLAPILVGFASMESGVSAVPLAAMCRSVAYPAAGQPYVAGRETLFRRRASRARILRASLAGRLTRNATIRSGAPGVPRLAFN